MSKADARASDSVLNTARNKMSLETIRRRREEGLLAMKRRLAERDRQWAEYAKTLYRQPRRIASRA